MGCWGKASQVSTYVSCNCLLAELVLPIELLVLLNEWWNNPDFAWSAHVLDKLTVNFCLQRLRSIHAKKTGKRDSSVGGEDINTSVNPTASRNKCKRKDGDSEEEDDDDDDSEDDDDDEEEEESVGKKGKKAEIIEEEVSDRCQRLTQCLIKLMSAVLTLMRSFHPGRQCTLSQHGGAGETDRENTQGKLNPLRSFFLSGSAHDWIY